MIFAQYPSDKQFSFRSWPAFDMAQEMLGE